MRFVCLETESFVDWSAFSDADFFCVQALHALFPLAPEQINHSVE